MASDGSQIQKEVKLVKTRVLLELYRQQVTTSKIRHQNLVSSRNLGLSRNYDAEFHLITST